MRKKSNIGIYIIDCIRMYLYVSVCKACICLYMHVLQYEYNYVCIGMYCMYYVYLLWYVCLSVLKGISMYCLYMCVLRVSAYIRVLYVYVGIGMNWLYCMCVCMVCIVCICFYILNMSENTYIYMQIQAIHAYTWIHTRYIKNPNVCIGMYIFVNTYKYNVHCLNTCTIHTTRFTDVCG